MKKGRGLAVVAVLLVAALGIFFVTELTGNIIYSEGFERTGFGNPYDIFNINPEYFNLIPENQQLTINVSVDRENGYVYRKGYYWAQSNWQQFTFPQETQGNSNWIPDTATTELTINATNNLANGLNFIVTYSCVKVEGNWECGEENSDDTNKHKWMLHLFDVSGVLNATEEREVGELEPIGIVSCEGLQNIVNDLKADYILLQDIDCSETANWNNGSGFSPIGGPSFNLSGMFQGSLDGKGHVITDLFIGKATSFTGLFFVLGENSTIRNLGLENINFTEPTTAFKGGISAICLGCNITDTYVTGNISGENQARGGGIVASNALEGVISNSYSLVNVKFTGDGFNTGIRVGSLAGANSHGSLIQNSFATGDVEGLTTAGGLVGDFSKGGPSFETEILNSSWVNHEGNPNKCTGQSIGLTPDCEEVNYTDLQGIDLKIRNPRLFNSWDFSDVWNENAGGYPTLRVQN